MNPRRLCLGSFLLTMLACSHADCLSPPNRETRGNAEKIFWIGSFEDENWRDRWRIQNIWGENNISRMIASDGGPPSFIRVRYPSGSWSPHGGMASRPIGGVGFRGNLGIGSREVMHLRYYVRFPREFDFVRGGKLPGLYGGTANTGGHIPNGRDGFSTRYMWAPGGRGQMYAYLPTSVQWGTGVGIHKLNFYRGVWQRLEQRLELNTPGKSDGVICIWQDGKLIWQERNVRFRDVPDLRIDGVIFETFFGGGDASWATPQDTYVDFGDFAVSSEYIGR